LDIQREQVKPIRSLYDETPNIGDNVTIHFLGLLFGQTAQIRLYSHTADHIWREYGPSQGQVPNRDSPLVQPHQGGWQIGVPQAKGRGGESD
jgi:hypothetical protein